MTIPAVHTCFVRILVHPGRRIVRYTQADSWYLARRSLSPHEPIASSNSSRGHKMDPGPDATSIKSLIFRRNVATLDIIHRGGDGYLSI
jgi:hypothetical protein